MYKRHKRAQVATEFIVLIAFLLLFFVVLAGLFASSVQRSEKERMDLRATDLITVVQNEIQLAATIESGYRREFTIPERIAASEYTIRIENEHVIIRVGGTDYSRPIGSVQGNLTTGVNIITQINGVVAINAE